MERFVQMIVSIFYTNFSHFYLIPFFRPNSGIFRVYFQLNPIPHPKLRVHFQPGQ